MSRHAPPSPAILESPQIVRHSFASRTLALGEALPVIGKLLGHSDIETTARYAHLAHHSVHDAAERIEAARAGRTDLIRVTANPPRARPC